MKPDIDKIKLIESFLEGDMTKEDQQAFEKELAENTTLQKEVELHKDIRKAIKRKGKSDLLIELNKYYENHKQDTNKNNIRKLFWPAVSVAASIIIILFVFLGKDTETIPSEKIITLDTAGIKKAPEYADSARFDSSINKNK